MRAIGGQPVGRAASKPYRGPSDTERIVVLAFLRFP